MARYTCLLVPVHPWVLGPDGPLPAQRPKRAKSLLKVSLWSHFRATCPRGWFLPLAGFFRPSGLDFPSNSHLLTDFRLKIWQNYSSLTVRSQFAHSSLTVRSQFAHVFPYRICKMRLLPSKIFFDEKLDFNTNRIFNKEIHERTVSEL